MGSLQILLQAAQRHTVQQLTVQQILVDNRLSGKTFPKSSEFATHELLGRKKILPRR